MKTKQIPAILMLIAGLITCIISFIYKAGIVQFLRNLCIILVVFFVLGEIIRYLIDKNFAEKESVEEEVQDEESEETEQKESNIENVEKE